MGVLLLVTLLIIKRRIPTSLTSCGTVMGVLLPGYITSNKKGIGYKLVLCIVLNVFMRVEPQIQTVQLRGRGATFPSDVYKNWMATYKAQRLQYKVEINMTYELSGSGAGKSSMQKVSQFLYSPNLIWLLMFYY